MTEQQTDVQNEISRPPENVDIELISTAKFREQLSGILRRDVPITYSHSGIKYEMGHSVGVKGNSTSEEPAVLFESGASPCSIVIAYDDANCKIIHISQYEKFLNKQPVKSKDVEKTLELNRNSLQELKEFISLLGANYRVVVTATNVSQELQEAVLSDITAELGVEGARMVELLLESEPIPNQPYPKIGITKDQIHTAIYIPRGYTHDSRSKIFIIGDTEDDLRNEENARWLITEAFKKQSISESQTG